MAKKKTTIIEEETPATPEEAQEINYKEDIQGKSTQEIAATPEPEVKEPEPEPTPEPVEEEMEDVEFDPEVLKKEAQEAVRKEILEAISGKKDNEVEDPNDEYDTFVKEYTLKNGVAPDWKVVAQFIKDRAIQDIKAENEAERQRIAEEQKVQKETEDAQQENVNKYVDSQFDELYATNRFPKIKNAEDPNDPGVAWRRALADQTMTINKERLDKGLPTKTLVEVFFTQFKAPNRQPAGVDAPISAGNAGGQGEDQEEINYIRDIRGSRTIRDILMRRK